MLERWDGYGNDPVTTGGPIGKAIKELHLINKETKLPNLKKFVKFNRTAFKNGAKKKRRQSNSGKTSVYVAIQLTESPLTRCFENIIANIFKTYIFFSFTFSSFFR